MRECDERLKPCPFCGNKAIMHQSIASRKYFAKCMMPYCGAAVFSAKNTIDEAVDAWNRRVTDEQ